MANQSSTPFDQGLFLVHLNRGREHFDQRNFIDAAEQLEEARRLRPDDDSVLNLLGLAYFKQEKYKRIRRRLSQTHRAQPRVLYPALQLGARVLTKCWTWTTRKRFLLRALELKPDNQKTHFYLGNIYEKKS